ncbi:MAG TPA: hypothetical protein VIK72_19320 [Clostridiaceae bacterium]
MSEAKGKCGDCELYEPFYKNRKGVLVKQCDGKCPLRGFRQRTFTCVKFCKKETL